MCMMGKCVCVWWGGRYVCLEKRSAISVSVCRVCGCQGGYFWNVMQMFVNFRSGTRYTGHSSVTIGS